MKRFFAFVLLTCAVFSLCCVCLADENEMIPQINVDEIFLSDKNSPPKRLERSGSSLRMEIEPESTLYFSIENARRAEDLNGLRAVTTWSKGEEYTLTPRIEYREMMDSDGVTSLGYRYVISMETTDITDDNAHTLRGTIKLAQRTSQKTPTVSFTLLLKKNAETGDYHAIKSDSQNIWIDFTNEDGSATILFYDFGYFDIDVQGQGLLTIGCSILPITDIHERYRDADLRFIRWSSNPIFDHVGRLVIPAEENEYLYELRGGKLVDRSDCYQEAELAFVVNTRRLEGFVLSDRPLPENANIQPEPNPPTGV